MKTTSLLLLIGLAAFGCGSGGSGDCTNQLIGGCESGGTDGDSVCSYQCAAMRELNCSASMVNCESSCMESRRGRSQCLTEDENFRVCFANASTLKCSSDTGRPVIVGSVCEPQTTALQNCLSANGEK